MASSSASRISDSVLKIWLVMVILFDLRFFCLEARLEPVSLLALRKGEVSGVETLDELLFIVFFLALLEGQVFDIDTPDELLFIRSLHTLTTIAITPMTQPIRIEYRLMIRRRTWPASRTFDTIQLF